MKSSVGHIRDLPTSGSNNGAIDPKARARAAAETRKLSPEQKEIHRQKKAKEQLVRRMGIDPDADWDANYQVLPGKEKVVSELQRLADSADTVYLATDLDREGEAIAWHLQEVIGGEPQRFKRVIFNEITQNAIQEAFAQPGDLDLQRVNAQQARRFLDRVVGFMVSPLLWSKVARGLSAGRVQSVAVKLIVEREREIKAFVPEEFWELDAHVLSADKDELKLAVKKHKGENFRPGNREAIDRVLAELQPADYIVSSREDRPTQSRPGAPYITSTLQQAASTRLGFSVKKTMTMAQRLYEAGYITYMRTDSTNLSAEAVASCRDYIENKFGRKYLPDTPNSYGSRENAQEAHEAIRPSDVALRAHQLQGVDKDAERLYELIWRQFVACQMPPARFLSSKLVVNASDYELRVNGRVIQFDGFMKVQPPQSKKEDDVVIPDLKPGDQLQLRELIPSQHFTKPTPRYTEASLVKELEKQGIGRPSTYAAIISTIQDRGYARIENRRFYAEKMGEIVTDRLSENFAELMDYGFTANMEEALDEVANGDRDWKALLNEFYSDFLIKLEAANDDDGMRANKPVEVDLQCSQCGRPMQVRTASTGVFLGCSGYSLPPKERCKNTINLVHGDEVVSADADDDSEQESLLLRKRHRCTLCGTAMDSYLVDESTKLHVCGNNPDCLGSEIEKGSYKIKGYDGPVIQCDKCQQDMQLKTGRFGKYFGCTSETCKNTRKLLRNGEAAPPKMDPVPMPELQCQKVDDHYVLRDGAAGMFLAASQFPKNRETRAPLLSEILPHKGEIDAKYDFLFSGPVADNKGNPSQVRYSRKTKEQYLMSEVDGKATGWQAFYVDGKWQEKLPAPKKKKSAAKKKAPAARSRKKAVTAKKSSAKTGQSRAS